MGVTVVIQPLDCKFLTSMVQMNRNSDPNAARFAAIVDSASITAAGTSMKVSVNVPQKDIEQLLPKPVPARRANAAPARRTPSR